LGFQVPCLQVKDLGKGLFPFDIIIPQFKIALYIIEAGYMKPKAFTFLAIFLPFLFLSAELKFDVPGNQGISACTPANTKYSENYWCYSDLEYTIVLWLRNDSDKTYSNVQINTEFPGFYMEYVPNSTEYGKNITDIGYHLFAENWVKIPDLENGGFPLEDGIFSFETIRSSEENDYTCSDENSFIIRYRVKIDAATPRNHVFEINALVKPDDNSDFWLTFNIPHKLSFYDNCVKNQEDIDMTKCGTIKTETSDENSDESSTQDVELIDDSKKNDNSGCSCIFI